MLVFTRTCRDGASPLLSVYCTYYPDIVVETLEPPFLKFGLVFTIYVRYYVHRLLGGGMSLSPFGTAPADDVLGTIYLEFDEICFSAGVTIWDI